MRAGYTDMVVQATASKPSAGEGRSLISLAFAVTNFDRFTYIFDSFLSYFLHIYIRIIKIDPEKLSSALNNKKINNTHKKDKKRNTTAVHFKI